MAELAGGGQPDRRTFELRVAELAALLEPGREVVFNTLLLDRHLWELHIAREALLFGARRAGAPFAGLTVSAGIPDVDEAIALLDRLAARGHARQRVQARDGRAGPAAAGDRRRGAAPHDRGAPRGRARGRAPLVGGPRGAAARDLPRAAPARRTCWCARAAASARPSGPPTCCTGRGRWRTARSAMPVDAVLVGTAAMAVRRVDRLAAGQGGAGRGGRRRRGWVPRRGVDGGVTSARSNLNADIHLLDNSASRAGHLLESVAGDADGRGGAARRDRRRAGA